MNRLRAVLAALLLSLAALSTATAVEPDEILDDPVLEERAREISSQLRCMVCQNQSIDDSDAELARDLRLIVRERLVAGDSNEQIFDYVVSRYGEFVLLKPRFSLKTAALWLAPAIVMGIGLIAVVMFLRGRRPQPAAGRLSAEEEAAVARLLDERREKTRRS
jgi:cytochrome c-type biogenesis protein CcmH